MPDYNFDLGKVKITGKTQRSTIDDFVLDKLSNLLERRKKNKIKNLLQDLRKEGKVRSPEYGVWEVI